MKHLVLSAAVAAALGMSGQAIAQQASSGEASSVFSCFYECAPGPVVNGSPTWQEVTNLMLANQSNRLMFARIVFLNGNERMIAQTVTELSPLDLDEVSVCGTLWQLPPPAQVPPAGLIEVVLTNSQGQFEVGTYGWIKDLLGKFFPNVPEPFANKVTGVGKTQCRLAPPGVIQPSELVSTIQQQNPPSVPAVLVEGTADLIP